MQTITLPTNEGSVTLSMAEFYEHIAWLYREGRSEAAEFLLDYEKSLRIKHFYG